MLKTAPLLCMVLILACGGPSRADDLTPEKIRDIKTLMSIGMPREADLAMWSRQVERTVWTLRQQHPQISDQQLRFMNDEAIRLYREKRDEPGGLTDRLVEIYHNHLSDDDVKQILDFFKTPIGQKVKSFLATRQIEAMPIIEQWQQEVLTAWLQSVMANMVRESMPPAKQTPR